jgi:hypothetical protein
MDPLIATSAQSTGERDRERWSSERACGAGDPGSHGIGLLRAMIVIMNVIRRAMSQWPWATRSLS